MQFVGCQLSLPTNGHLPKMGLISVAKIAPFDFEWPNNHLLYFPMLIYPFSFPTTYFVLVLLVFHNWVVCSQLDHSKQIIGFLKSGRYVNLLTQRKCYFYRVYFLQDWLFRIFLRCSLGHWVVLSGPDLSLRILADEFISIINKQLSCVAYFGV